MGLLSDIYIVKNSHKNAVIQVKESGDYDPFDHENKDAAGSVHRLRFKPDVIYGILQSHSSHFMFKNVVTGEKVLENFDAVVYRIRPSDKVRVTSFEDGLDKLTTSSPYFADKHSRWLQSFYTVGDFTDEEIETIWSTKDTIFNFDAKQGGMATKSKQAKTSAATTSRKVRMDGTKPYVQMNGSRIYLSTIRGKYRYSADRSTVMIKS